MAQAPDKSTSKENGTKPAVPPLSTYYVYLTAGCNLACRHCWIAPTYQPRGDSGGHLPPALMELAIEQGRPLGLRRIKLTGGEPTLHPDFFALCELMQREKIHYWMESNGILIGAEEARQIKELAG